MDQKEMKPKTTCCNRECKEYLTCTHNIWSDGLNCKTNQYMSQKQSIYKRYVDNGGMLSPAEYHNC